MATVADQTWRRWIGHVHDPQPSIALGQIGEISHHLHADRRSRGDPAEQDRRGRVGDVDDLQPGVAGGQIREMAHDDDRVGDPGDRDAADDLRRCRRRDVDDLQASGVVGDVREIAVDHDAARLAGRVDTADDQRRGRVADIDHLQAQVAHGEVGVSAGHGEAVGDRRHGDAAHDLRRGGIRHVDDPQAEAVVRDVGVCASHDQRAHEAGKIHQPDQAQVVDGGGVEHEESGMAVGDVEVIADLDDVAARTRRREGTGPVEVAGVVQALGPGRRRRSNQRGGQPGQESSDEQRGPDPRDRTGMLRAKCRVDTHPGLLGGGPAPDTGRVMTMIAPESGKRAQEGRK